MARRAFTGITGLPLPRRAIRALREGDLWPRARQHRTPDFGPALRLARLGVGRSSGGVGRYLIFSIADGQRPECFHLVEAIAVKGLHAVIIASELVRVDMLRKDRAYELLITAHRVGPADKWRLPSARTPDSVSGRSSAPRIRPFSPR